MAKRLVPVKRGHGLIKRMFRKHPPHIKRKLHVALQRLFPVHRKLFLQAKQGQHGGGFMDKAWWERLGKRMANAVVTYGSLGFADAPYKNV